MRRRASVCVLLLTASCAGTDVGNPPSSPPITGVTSVTLRITGTRPSPQGLVLDDGTRVDEAWVVVERVRLRTVEDCEGAPGKPDHVPGPIAVELVSGRTLPEVPVIEVDEASYCRLELDLDALVEGDVAGAPEALVGNSLLVTGARADGVAFTIAGAVDPRFELDARAAPFEVSGDAAELVVLLDFAAWVAAAKLDEAEPSGGAIVIDAETDHERLEDVSESIEESSELLCEREGRHETCGHGSPEHEDDEDHGGGGGGGSGP